MTEVDQKDKIDLLKYPENHSMNAAYKKICLSLVVALLLVLGWSPWLSKDEVRVVVNASKNFQYQHAVEKGTADPEIHVTWLPFCRWVTTYEGGWPVCFWHGFKKDSNLVTEISSIGLNESANGKMYIDEVTSTNFSIPDTKIFTSWLVYNNYQYGFSFEYPEEYAENSCWIKNYPSSSTQSDSLDYWLVGSRIELSVSSSTSSLEINASSSLPLDAIQEKSYISVNGVKSLKVNFRFGGTGRYGEAVFIPYHDKVFQLRFTAGGFVCGFESSVFNKILQSFTFIQEKNNYPNLVFHRRASVRDNFKLDADYPEVITAKDNLAKEALNFSLGGLEIDINNFFRTPSPTDNLYQRHCSPLVVNQRLIKFQCTVQTWYDKNTDGPQTQTYSLNAQTGEWIK